MTDVKRKPWKYIGSEDVTVTRLRQHIREAEYWTARARHEAGPDGQREELCKKQGLTFRVALGEVLRCNGWRPHTRGQRVPYFGEMVNPDGEAAYSLWIAGEYLQMVERDGRDAVISGFDPFDPEAGLKPQKTWH